MAFAAGLLKGAHVVGQPGQAQQAALPAQHLIGVLGGPAPFPFQKSVQAGVHIATAGAHHQPFQGREAHAGVAAVAILHRATGATVAQVGGQPATGVHR